jgi:hypothetical protein
MKCDDCPVGGQHNYGANRFNPLDNPHHDFPIGCAYLPSGAHTQQPPRSFIEYPIILSEPVRKGWICPRCDNAVSPDEKVCPHCKPKPKKEADNGERTHITETD